VTKPGLGAPGLAALGLGALGLAWLEAVLDEAVLDEAVLEVSLLTAAAFFPFSRLTSWFVGPWLVAAYRSISLLHASSYAE